MITTGIFIGIALKSLVIGAVTLGALWLVRRRSASVRSMVGHLGLVVLVALPLLTLLLPAWSALTLPTPLAVEAPILAGGSDMPSDLTRDIVASTSAAKEGPGIALRELALALYLLPLGLLLGATIVAIARLFSMRRRAAVLVAPPWLAALAQAQRRMGFKTGAALLVSDELRSPISWGLVRPTIVLNADIVSVRDDAEAIIAHELAHVDHLDWAKLLMARIACAMFWFNPLVWVLARECHQLREENADDAVLRADVDRLDYATLLVHAARHDNAAMLLAAHGVAPGRGSLKRRIQRVLDARLDRRRVGVLGGSLGILVVIGLATPLAALQPRKVSLVAESASEAIAEAAFEATEDARDDSNAIKAEIKAEVEAELAASARNRSRRERAVRRGSATEAIVAARAVGVDAGYIAALRDNLGTVALDDVVAARAVGVGPGYIAEMRRRFPGADIDDLIGARAVGVSAAYAAGMQDRFPEADLDDITGMRAIGVTNAFVDAARRSGIQLADADDATALRAVTGRHGPAPPEFSSPPSLPPPPPER